MKLIDRPLSELEIPDGVIVAAIHRGLNVIIPNGDTIIQEGDRVIFFSLLTELPELEKMLRDNEKLPFFKRKRQR